MTTITWTTADGIDYLIDLTQTDDALGVEGLKGRGGPPVRYSRDRTPGLPGSTIRSIEDDTRVIEIPIGIYGATEAALSEAVEAWIRHLDPNRGDGTLTFTTGAGATRSIKGRCVNGLDIYEKLGAGTNVGWVWWTAEFECEPYFYDPSTKTDSWSIDDPQEFFPFQLPFQLASSSVFASPTITNAGHVATYPVWTIVGPASNITLTHVLTGRVLAWDGTLGAGEVLTLDARDRPQTTTPNSALLQDGTDVFNLLSARDFFPFAVGSQQIEIVMVDGDTGSEISVQWLEYYRSAY